MIYLARAAHVPGVVWWIGGVAMVTATLLPPLALAATAAAVIGGHGGW